MAYYESGELKGMTTAVVIPPHNLQNLARNGAPGRIRTCDPRLSHDGTTGSDSQFVSTLRVRACIPQSPVQKELVMKKARFVGLDVHADTIAVAVASRAGRCDPWG